MDSDRVLVMDFGKIIEFDHPYRLLKNTDGFFYKMVEQTGKDTAHILHGVASKVSQKSNYISLSHFISHNFHSVLKFNSLNL